MRKISLWIGLIILPISLLTAQQLIVDDALSAISIAESVPDPTVADSVTALLPEMVITAARRPTLRLEAPEAITILTAANLKEAGHRTAPESLERLPGLWVQKTNHGGGSPFVRGLTGNQVLFLIDGIRLNNATFRFGPNQYFNTLDAFSLQRIEAMRGSGSVLYGSDAIGGAVQALTRNPLTDVESGWHGALTGQFQSQGQENTGRADVSYRGERFGALAGVTRRDFGDLKGGKNTGFQRPSGYDEWAADAKIQWQARPNLRLTAAGQYLTQNDVPLFHRIQLENFARNHFIRQTRSLGYARAEISTARLWAKSIQITAYRQMADEAREQRRNGSATARFENDQVGTIGLTSTVVSQFRPWWTATSGIELLRDAVSSERYDQTVATGQRTARRGLYPDGSTYRQMAAFSLHEWRVGRWNLGGGLRWNAFRGRLTDENLGALTISPEALVGQASVLYQAGAKTALLATWHGGFRAPNVDDLGSLGIVDFRYELPNYELRPERSNNFQAGAKYYGTRWQAEAYLFQNYLSDFIVRTRSGTDSIGGYPVFQKENTGRALIRGAEANLRGQILSWLTVEGAFNYAWGQNTSGNEPMRRIPPLNGWLALEVRNQHWVARAEYVAATAQTRLAAGDRSDNRIPIGGTPGWNVCNLSGGWATRHWSVHLGVRNLFDRSYRTHGSGIDAPGRSVWLRLTACL